MVEHSACSPATCGSITHLDKGHRCAGAWKHGRHVGHATDDISDDWCWQSTTWGVGFFAESWKILESAMFHKQIDPSGRRSQTFIKWSQWLFHDFKQNNSKNQFLSFNFIYSSVDSQHKINSQFSFLQHPMEQRLYIIVMVIICLNKKLINKKLL